MTKDERVCFEETDATPQDREAACARIGVFGIVAAPATLAGQAPARRVPVPKRGCKVATWGGQAWRVNHKAERAGAEIVLGPGQLLVCGNTRLKNLAKLLPQPTAMRTDLGRTAAPLLPFGLGADTITAQKHTVDVVVGLDGITRVKINGVKGPACADIARAIKAATGLDVISDSATAEYYEEPVSITTTVKTRYSLEGP